MKSKSIYNYRGDSMLLYFDNILILNLNESIDVSDIIRKPYFKIHLRRYIDKIEQERILFKQGLTIKRISKVKDIIKEREPRVTIDSSVIKHITDKEYYIDSRRRVGNDIKKRDSSIENYLQVFSGVVNGKMARPLTDEQMLNAFYMYSMKNVSNFSVPGSGKTATVLGTYSYMKSKGEVSRIVMIGPKNAFGSWIDEYKICFDIEDEHFFLNIHSNELSNVDKRKYALRLDSGSKELILINYESIESLKEEVKKLINKNTLLVLDEVHKIKNPTGKRANAVLDVSKDAYSIIALTGTPIPNSYKDIYNLLNILYREDYEDFFGFTTKMLNEPSKENIESINLKIKPFFCRVSKDALKVPKANEDFVIKTKVSIPEERLFKILFQLYKNNLFALLIRVLQLESNPKELLKSLDVNDLKYVVDDESDYSVDVDVMDYSAETIRLIENIEETTKLRETMSLIKRLVSEKKPVIVWCNLISSMSLLEEKCGEYGIKAKLIYGEVPLDERLILIEDF